MKYNEFKTREEYLAYRSEWKAEYQKLIKTIRQLRYMAKEESRACNLARQQLPKEYSTEGQYCYGWYKMYFDKIQELLKSNEHYQNLCKDTNAQSYNINKYRQRATQMLEELKLAKLESQRQYLLHKTFDISD